MNRELISVIEQIGREKGIDKEILFEALESALLSASRKSLGPADNVRMHIDRKSGDLRVYCRKKVVEEVTDDKLEISLADAKALNREAELGDELELEQERPPQEFGRIAAQTAKQVILQKVRDAEREGIYSEFAGKEGQILRGVVHRIEKRNVILEIGKAEAILPEREQIPGERYNPGDRIRAYVLEVRRTAKGPQISLSRTHPGDLTRLLQTEIPEIQEGIVLVKATAREAGPAAKVALAATPTGMPIDFNTEAEVEAERSRRDTAPMEARAAVAEMAVGGVACDAIVAAGLGSPAAIVKAGRERLARIAEFGEQADAIYSAAEKWVATHSTPEAGKGEDGDGRPEAPPESSTPP